MCDCGGGCGHRHGHCGGGYGYGWGEAYGPGGGYYRRSRGPTQDEMIDDLQEYKENLEAEIRRLEKRIGSLKTNSAADA